MPALDQIKIVDIRVYYIGESDLSIFHEETGWYCDIVFSDDGIGTYGPFDTETDAASFNCS